MENNKSTFAKVLTYTGIESIVYQALLFTHQMFLFKTLPSSLYGKIGLLFSAIFLGVHYANMGLDISLVPLFKRATQNRHLFKQLIVQQILYTLIFATGILTLLLSLFHTTQYTHFYAPLCALLVLTETYKKNAKNVLHLAFKQRTITITEITTLLIYVGTVWGAIIIGLEPSVGLILVPMLGISLINITVYSWSIRRFYYTLAEQQVASPIEWQYIIKMRFKNFVYQLTRSLYSGNFLVPLIASQYGLELAGLLKIISMSAYSINSMIQHIFGITSDVFFSSMKGSHKQIKTTIFAKLSSYIYHILFVLCLALFLHHRYIQFLSPNMPIEHIYIIYLFLLVLFSENIALTHEHLFIVEEKTIILIVSNTLLLIPLCITQYLNISCSVYSLFFGLLVARTAGFMCLSLFSWYTWNLRPKLGIKPMYLSASAAIAFICFLLS